MGNCSVLYTVQMYLKRTIYSVSRCLFAGQSMRKRPKLTETCQRNGLIIQYIEAFRVTEAQYKLLNSYKITQDSDLHVLTPAKSITQSVIPFKNNMI